MLQKEQILSLEILQKNLKYSLEILQKVLSLQQNKL